MNENAGCQEERPTLHRLLDNIGGLSQELSNLASETIRRVRNIEDVPEPLKSSEPARVEKLREPTSIVEKLEGIEGILKIAQLRAVSALDQLSRLVGS